MKKLIYFVVFFVICLTGYAQELQKNYINYQGVANDASGDAITDTAIAIQIALKFGSATATASYIETHALTTDANGVFSLQIGNGNVVSGTYDASNWGTDASYITVSLNGTEVGTTEMVAVPYAISSGDKQWVLNGTDIENKNTGTVNILTNLDITGNITVQTGATINEFSTDGTLTDNSDTAIPTEKAIKTYVDNATNTTTSINDLTDGKSDNDGSNNGSSLFLGINAGANDDGTNNKNVGIGYQALRANTTGEYNTANGYQVLIANTTGDSNTANGYRALYSNTTGNSNTANGNSALRANTTGYFNTANGVISLYSNTTGISNTANGSKALFSNTTGNNNTANGRSALESNTTGNSNTANGVNSLYSNTTGHSNTANGRSALESNTTGAFNTANGSQALESNTTGDYNTANGYRVLYLNTTGTGNTGNGNSALKSNTEGNSNIANGSFSLKSNTTGNRNSANGSQALESNTTGNNNTANGYSALFSNTTGSGNVALGYNAGYNETSSNKLYIANTDTTTPLIYGEFDNDILRINGELQVGDPTATGYKLPITDGTTNQVLQTNGNGALNWADASGIAIKINDLTDGKSDANGSSLFLGIDAGANDSSTYNENVGIGFKALYSNTTGSRNTANGYQALTANSMGYNNTANGSYALTANTTGYENTANGYIALYHNSTGSGNVALGYSAGYYETGSNKLYIANNDSTTLIYGEFDTQKLTINGDFTVNGNYNEVNATDSGDADMKAYIYGLAGTASGGVSAASSDGFTYTRVSAGHYRITFDVFMEQIKYITVATLHDAIGFINLIRHHGYFDVKTYNTSGTLADRGFYFVTYKK